MPVSSLTPLSLTASVNLSRLKEAFRDLENNYDFFVDDGSWCCTTCANSNAWDEGEGKPFVYWHEQNEDQLHVSESFEMPVHFGFASNMASLEKISQVAKTIISVLEKHNIPTVWDGDLDKCIIVEMDEHKPYLGGEDDPFEEEEDYDHNSVTLYLPYNKKTKNYCLNESDEEFGEPKNTFYFEQKIKDGESLKDAIMHLPKIIIEYITHYQRNFNTGNCTEPVEPIFEIEEDNSHAFGVSLKDALEAEDNKNSSLDKKTNEK